MNEYPRLIINTKGLKKDKFYIGGLIVFWLIWTPITLFFCIGAIVDFHWFLLIWLPFGLAGVILIPIKLYGVNGSQFIIAEAEGIRILSDRALFQKEVFITRDDLKSILIGHFESDSDRESVLTLNIFKKSGLLNRRVMIAPFVHPSEKRIIYSKLVSFLINHGFSFEALD